jgi:hypothetical protein
MQTVYGFFNVNDVLQFVTIFELRRHTFMTKERGRAITISLPLPSSYKSDPFVLEIQRTEKLKNVFYSN